MLRILIFLGATAILLGASAALAFPPIDLTVAGSSYTSADGTIWTQITTQPTGTGVYDPFLRFQANGEEGGMNTDGNAHQSYDDKAGVWTHSVLMSDLQVVNHGGVDYYSFSCDINEPNGGKNLLSLDELRLYTAPGSAGGSLLTEAAVTGAGGTLRYDLDATVDQDVYMDYVDGKYVEAHHSAEFAAMARYPLDIADGRLEDLIDVACREEVSEWRDRWVGQDGTEEAIRLLEELGERPDGSAESGVKNVTIQGATARATLKGN